jgi:IS66 C-terminal element/Transposase IS66 family
MLTRLNGIARNLSISTIPEISVRPRNPRLIEHDFRSQSRQPMIRPPVKPTREAQSGRQTEQHRRLWTLSKPRVWQNGGTGRRHSSARLALDNNPAERALRCVAIGRKNYLFAGSDAGGRRAAAMYSLVESAKLNGLNPQQYLADVLARIADHPARRIHELLPWHWQPINAALAAA